jgi:hypothetical protein
MTPQCSDSLEPDAARQGPDTATAHGHRDLRPQLSRAFKALYGSHKRKGIIFGLQVRWLVTFVQCLGEQFAHTSQDPVFYLRTADMKASHGGSWENVPSRFAYDQRQWTITTVLTLSASAGRDEQQGGLRGKHFYRSRTTQNGTRPGAPRGPQAGSNPFGCDQLTVPPRGSVQSPTSLSFLWKQF